MAPSTVASRTPSGWPSDTPSGAPLAAPSAAPSSPASSRPSGHAPPVCDNLCAALMSVFLPIFVIVAALVAYQWRTGRFRSPWRGQSAGGLRTSLLSAAHLDARVLSGEFEGESPYAASAGAPGHEAGADGGEAYASTEATLSLLTDEQKAFLDGGRGRGRSEDEDEDEVDSQEEVPRSVNEADV